jgi:hypothetical protein
MPCTDRIQWMIIMIYKFCFIGTAGVLVVNSSRFMNFHEEIVILLNNLFIFTGRTDNTLWINFLHQALETTQGRAAVLLEL